MRLLQRVAVGLVVCLTQVSCSNSRPPASAPPRPLPAEYAVQCPPPVESVDRINDYLLNARPQ